MALDVTVNLTDARETELTKLANEWTAGFPQDPHTPSQHLRVFVRDWLDQAIRVRVDSEKLGLRAAYKQATPQEQAQIDAILSKYL